jgi:hypothetical protein
MLLLLLLLLLAFVHHPPILGYDNGFGLLVSSYSPPRRPVAVYRPRHRRQISAF